MPPPLKTLTEHFAFFHHSESKPFPAGWKRLVGGNGTQIRASETCSPLATSPLISTYKQSEQSVDAPEIARITPNELWIKGNDFMHRFNIRHQQTFDSIVGRSTHNLEWPEVRSLLTSVADIDEGLNGALHFLHNGETVTLHADNLKSDITQDDIHAIGSFLQRIGLVPMT